MATCLDVAGVEYPAEFKGRKPLPLEGKSLAPILRGKRRAGHKELCWSAPRNQAILMGKWKLVNAGQKRPWELYDIESDATETRNVAREQPKRVAEMARHYEVWRRRVGAK